LNSLCEQLEKHIYALWIISSLQGDSEEWILVDLKGLYEFLDQPASQNKVIGLSLLDHCFRLNLLEQVLKHLSMLKVIEPIKELLTDSYRILTDPRVLQLFADISNISKSRIEELILGENIRVDFVDSQVPMKGWVTPIGIVLNPAMMNSNSKETERKLIFARIVGNEFTHFLCRLYDSDFGISTPERQESQPTDSSLNKLISRLRESFDIDNHIESGLIFELSFFGAKFSFQDHI
jgi:hypothetical protein